MGKRYIHQDNAPASFALSVQEFLTTCHIVVHIIHISHIQCCATCLYFKNSHGLTCKVHTAIRNDNTLYIKLQYLALCHLIFTLFYNDVTLTSDTGGLLATILLTLSLTAFYLQLLGICTQLDATGDCNITV